MAANALRLDLGERLRDWREGFSLHPAARRALAVLALIAFGGFWGIAVAILGLPALLLAISFVASIFVLRDYRVGVALLIVIMPISQSYVFPHEMFGVTGMNPLNLLLVATLGSFYMRAAGDGTWRFFMPRPVFWLYVVPMGFAAYLGMSHVNEIPGIFHDLELIFFNTGPSYVRDMYLKPLIFVFYAMLVGAAVVHSERAERFIVPMVISVAVMAAVVVVFIAISGLSLSQLAGVYARHLLSAIGMHANDLGRLYATAYALLLFVWDRTRTPGWKLVLLIAMGLVVLALLLTFSRGAFLGFILVNLIYLFARRKSKIMWFAIPALPVALALVPGAVWYRMTTGFGGGWNDITAGRSGDIWAPVMPVMMDHPLVGSGLGSIMWSRPMLTGELPPVSHPHNAYLQVWMDHGLLGTVLLVAFWLWMWRQFRVLMREPTVAAELQGFFEGAAAGLLAFLIAGMAGSSLKPVPEQAFLWLAAGMMFGVRAKLARAQKLARKRAKPGR